MTGLRGVISEGVRGLAGDETGVAARRDAFGGRSERLVCAGSALSRYLYSFW